MGTNSGKIPYSDIAIIFNPKSTGSAKDNAQELREQLIEAIPGVPVVLLPTERAGHAVELAHSFARSRKAPLIISASGDGGYNEVINGALKAQSEGANPVCAVLPSGNANDHARTMQDKPLSELIIAGKITELDVLEVKFTQHGTHDLNRFAHSYVGIGLTPTIAVELNKHTLNSLMEAWIITKTFWNIRPVTILVSGVHLRLDSLICSTIPEMAKVLSFSKKTEPRDGLFEVTTFKHRGKLRLLLRLLKGIFRHLEAGKQTSRYDFTLLVPAPMQLDGEVMEVEAGTEVSVRTHKKLLRSIATV
jgi:diacylglycerol kinase (ATP)